MLRRNSVFKGAIIFSILGATVCGVGCVDKDASRRRQNCLILDKFFLCI